MKMPINRARRGLLSGTCVLAGAADLAHPDAELTRVCAEFRASEAKMTQMLDPSQGVPDDEAQVICGRTTDEWDGMLARMEALPATTLEGFLAVALCLAQHSCQPGHDYAFEFDPEDGTVTGRLLHMTMQNGARLAAVGRA